MEMLVTSNENAITHKYTLQKAVASDLIFL
jgi:hypothetical protein